MRALRRAHAPDLLDLGAGHRLVIGDDGERLQRGARQAALLDRLLLEQERQILRGAERPFAGDAHEIDAAPGIEAAQLLEQRADVLALDEVPGQGLLVQRLGRGKQKRLDDAELLAPIGRLQLDDIGRKRQRKARWLSLRLVFRHCLDPTQLLRCHPRPRCCCFAQHITILRRARGGAPEAARTISPGGFRAFPRASFPGWP